MPHVEHQPLTVQLTVDQVSRSERDCYILVELGIFGLSECYSCKWFDFVESRATVVENRNRWSHGNQWLFSFVVTQLS